MKKSEWLFENMYIKKYIQVTEKNSTKLLKLTKLKLKNANSKYE